MYFNLKLMENGYLKVGVVSNSDAKRIQMMNAFNGLKFQGVKGYSTFASLEEPIRKGQVDWVLASFTDDAGANLLDFLENLYGETKRLGVIVSCLLNSNELKHVPQAFSLGLFSWHPDKGVTEYTRQALWKLKRKVSQVNGLESMIPYLYYRAYLKQRGLWDEHVKLSEQMIRTYRYEDIIKLHLVEAYILAGYEKKGRALLAELEYFEPALGSKIAEVRQTILGDQPQSNQSLAEQYYVKHAVVIHKAEVERNRSKQILETMGFKTIHCYSDAEEAWLELSNQKIDLLIFDWQLEGTSGSSLLQRVRLCSLWNFPVIAYADAMSASDSQIATQFSVAQILSSKSSEYLKTIAFSWVIVQSKEPTEVLGLEAKIFERLGKKDVARAYRYFEKFLEVASRDPAKERYLKAQIDLAEYHYLDAKYLLMEANFESKVNSIKIDTLMAKCLLELGEYQGVLNILKRIKKQSPKNLLILGTLANAYAFLGDFEHAEAVIDEALAIDRGHPWIRRLGGKISLVRNMLPQVEERVDKGDMQLVIMDTNNLAAQLFQSKMPDKSINLYKTLIDFVEAQSLKDEFEGVLRYNLALAYARHGDESLAKSQAKISKGLQHNVAEDLASELLSLPMPINDDVLFFYLFDERSYAEVHNGDGKITQDIIDSGEIIDFSDNIFLRGLLPQDRVDKVS